MKVLKMEPGKAPYRKEIEKGLKASQTEVEGMIECIGLEDGCVAVINEEGKINGMEPNRRMGEDIICGPFFICGCDQEGNFVSLTEPQFEKYSRKFGAVEEFTGQEPELQPRIQFMTF